MTDQQKSRLGLNLLGALGLLACAACEPPDNVTNAPTNQQIEDNINEIEGRIPAARDRGNGY